jgi:hypothetical protein
MMAIDGLLQNRPDIGTAWLVKSWALQQNNEISKALIAAEKAVECYPESVNAQNNLVGLLLKFDQVDKTIEP